MAGKVPGRARAAVASRACSSRAHGVWYALAGVWYAVAGVLQLLVCRHSYLQAVGLLSVDLLQFTAYIATVNSTRSNSSPERRGLAGSATFFPRLNLCHAAHCIEQLHALPPAGHAKSGEALAQVFAYLACQPYLILSAVRKHAGSLIMHMMPRDRIPDGAARRRGNLRANGGIILHKLRLENCMFTVITGQRSRRYWHRGCSTTWRRIVSTLHKDSDDFQCE